MKDALILLQRGAKIWLRQVRNLEIFFALFVGNSSPWWVFIGPGLGLIFGRRPASHSEVFS